jgi:hypothetical protein
MKRCWGITRIRQQRWGSDKKSLSFSAGIFDHLIRTQHCATCFEDVRAVYNAYIYILMCVRTCIHIQYKHTQGGCKTLGASIFPWKRKKTLNCLWLCVGLWGAVPLSLGQGDINVISCKQSINQKKPQWDLERGVTFWLTVVVSFLRGGSTGVWTQDFTLAR